MLFKFKHFYPFYRVCKTLPYRTELAFYRFSSDKKSPPPIESVNIPGTKADGQTIDEVAKATPTGTNQKSISSGKEIEESKRYIDDQVKMLKLEMLLDQERKDKERLEKERLEKENQPFWVKWKNMSLSQIVWNVIKLMFGAASLALIVNSALEWFSIKANEKIAEIQRQQYLAQKQQLETQKKQADLEAKKANIYTEQKADQLVKDCSTINLQVPKYYVQISQLNKEISKLITRQKQDSNIQNRFFLMVEGFPGYGKSTGFFNEINHLRKEKIINQKGEKEDRNIYYFGLKVEEDKKQMTSQQRARAQEQKLVDLRVLIHKLRNLPFEKRKNTTLVIDDINVLEKLLISDETKVQLLYFHQIYNLHRSSVNVICISSSDRFLQQVSEFSVVSKFSMNKFLPIPTIDQRKKILKQWWKAEASRFGTEVPDYVEKYFMASYSSIRNMLNVLSLLKSGQYLVNVDKAVWMKNVEMVEQQIIQKKVYKIKSQLDKKLLQNKQIAKIAKITINGLLANYKMQKMTNMINIRELYPDLDMESITLAQEIIKILSKARIVGFNQIIGEIQMKALKEYQKQKFGKK